ncbi:protein ADM2a [Denticeps clupeoides]|uniref:ADM2 n=1 Tax=Denticeps clupeoides TaxID=299321 RepID=A0AAY4DZ17_9TELE|nr:protein ADM2 [Denticeps clupeoides]
MRCLLPVAVCCVSLFSLQELLALPVGGRLQRSRLGIPERLHEEQEHNGILLDSTMKNAPLWPPRQPSQHWRALLLKHTPQESTDMPPWLDPVALAGEKEPRRRGRRGRRHVNSRSYHHPHHAQLMRVGCVLGTCQVQNLSHRLYQLMGQSGREDSSPINPRSPHSYG